MVCAKDPMGARTLLLKGETQVHEHKEQYGKLSAKRLKPYLIHDYDACKDALRQAEALCKHLNVRHSSALYQTLIQTQQTISPDLLSIRDCRTLFDCACESTMGRYESGSSRYPKNALF